MFRLVIAWVGVDMGVDVDLDFDFGIGVSADVYLLILMLILGGESDPDTDLSEESDIRLLITDVWGALGWLSSLDSLMLTLNVL